MTPLPLWPEGVRCGTCKHWGPYQSGAHRECRLVTTDENTPGPRVLPGDYGTGGGDLLTPPDYACNRWEPKP